MGKNQDLHNVLIKCFNKDLLSTQGFQEYFIEVETETPKQFSGITLVPMKYIDKKREVTAHMNSF